MPRTGRPKSENPKSTQLGVRFAEQELKKLDVVAEYYETSRADAIRKCVDEVYSDLQKKND